MSKDSETKRLLDDSEDDNSPIDYGVNKKRLLRSRWIPACWYKDCFPCIKARYVLSFMLFLGLCNVYALRVNLSVAIVPMTSKNPPHNQRHFDWTNKEQGLVLGSFFYGYLLTQIPGGWIATRFGGKHVFGTGVLVTSVLTLITPQMAEISLWALITVRIIIGFFEGVTFPAMIAMFGVWSPPLERSMMSTIGSSGPFVGSIIAFPLSGVLCDVMGWPWVFYCFGVAGIVWYAAWLILIFNTPADHPRISPKEQYYIKTSIKEEMQSKQNDTSAKEPPPWRHILTSPAVLAVIITNFCSNWGFYTLITCLPTFLDQTLCLNITKNGLYSAIPYTCMAIVSLSWGQVTDILRQRKVTSTTIIRKINTTLGLSLPAVFLILCGYFGTSVGWAIVFLSLSVGTSGFITAGSTVNNLDIAPKYAGIICGLSNMFGTIPGFVGPLVAKIIAEKPAIEPCGNSCKDPFTIGVYQEEWRLVFFIAMEIYVFGAVAYVILGSGKKQSWADGHHTYKKYKTLASLCS